MFALLCIVTPCDFRLRFHAYAVVMELDTYESMPLNPETNQANILLKKTYGGVPPGAGVRDDVILLFEELEEARNNLGQIQALKDALPKEQSDSKNSCEYCHDLSALYFLYYHSVHFYLCHMDLPVHSQKERRIRGQE